MTNHVVKNPAGWLRKAIEEDYAPPRNYQRSRQHKSKEAKDTKIPQPEARERHIPKEECHQVTEGAKTQLLEQHPPQPVGEEGLTTKETWNLALETQPGSEYPAPLP
jgi:hypothetical protein